MCIDCNEREIDRREGDGSTGGSALKRRSFLQTTAVVGAGTVLGSQATPAQASHVECDGADQFVASPNYSSREQEIDWIVIHVTTGTYSGALSWFQNPDSNVSAHYVVSNYADTAYDPGYVTQMVHEDDAAWHARSIANERSIGIELEWIDGHSDEPITEECYRAAAEIARCVADRYDIPLTFYEEETCIQNEPGGIIGHSHVPDGSCASFDHDGRTCPYPDFDPDTFMSYVREENSGGGEKFADGDEVVTTTALNARKRPHLDSEVTTVLDEGTTAEIINGPETADGYTWWGLYVPEPSVWVWCVEQYLELAGSSGDGSGDDGSGDDGSGDDGSGDDGSGDDGSGDDGSGDDGSGDDGNNDDGNNDDDDDDGGFCFLTTATANDRQTLDSLRRFRDESMSATPLGRRLVWLYYRISPPIAATLDRHPDSKTAGAVRALVERCATLSDTQSETESRVESAAIGTVLTVLYMIGILTAAGGHAAIRTTERVAELRSPGAQSASESGQ